MSLALVAWLITSIIGLALALYGVRDARRDQAALTGEPNGRHLIARHYLLRYLLRACVFTIWLVAPLTIYVSQDGTALTIVLIAANVLLVTTTTSDLYVGAMLRRMYRE